MTRQVVLSLVLVAALAGCGGHAGPRAATPPPPSAGTKQVPVVRHVRGPHDAAVPVLVYHVIGTDVTANSLEGLYVAPAQFRTQVDWLARNGWHAVTLDQVLAYWRDGVALPPKPIVLTFDDGYPGDWQYAMPVLRAHHWAGVLNLQIGNLVPKRVRELMRAGWQIAAHTFTHPDLTRVGSAQLRHETLDARRWLQRMYRVPVDVFCYPYGHYDAAVVAAVRAAGYAAAETENAGWASPGNGLLTLDRIRVGPTTGPAQLAGLLR